MNAATSGRGLLVVLSAPSGAGKRALRRVLLHSEPQLRFCPSVTTRPPRAGEADGVDYIFVAPAAFDRLVEQGEFAEWAYVFGHRYGTLSRSLETLRSTGADVLVEKDVRGALALRRQYPDGVLVFVLPPSLGELKRRIVSRGTESPEEICCRLSRVREELEHAGGYDYILVNDHLEQAAANLRGIVCAERARAARQKHLLGAYLDAGEDGVE